MHYYQLQDRLEMLERQLIELVDDYKKVKNTRRTKRQKLLIQDIFDTLTLIRINDDLMWYLFDVKDKLYRSVH